MARKDLRILLPLDGSETAENILAALLPLRERKPLFLTLLAVVTGKPSGAAMKVYLSKAAAALRRPRVEVRTELGLGDPASEILAHARSGRSALIAMSTHGRTGVRRLLMGSVTEKVLRHSPIPLLACRPGSRMEGWNHVVALDGSARAEAVLEDVVPFARLVGARLHLLHVRPRRLSAGLLPGTRSGSGDDIAVYLKHIMANLSALGLTVCALVRKGDPATEILRYAKEVRAGIVALASHGRTGLGRVLLGSVAEDVLRKASCPVLLRREPARPDGPPPEAVLA